MTATMKPVFGKRQAVGLPGRKPVEARRADRGPAGLSASIGLSPAETAFLASVRTDFAETNDRGARVVPRSSRAALLAGLVVGCALVGFDASGSSGTAKVAAFAGLVGVDVNPTNLLPALIVLGLVGGARSSALTVIAVHGLLRKARQTSHAAYGVAGAAASVAVAMLFSVFGHVPAHGWLIEAVSGAGAGFFYRVFAGSQTA